MTTTRNAAAPSGHREGGSAHQPGGLDLSISNTADALTGADADAEVFFRNCYAVLVRGAHVRRHLYFNLPAAERAVRRANGRGDSASMTLVRLVPVRGGQDG